MEPGLRLLLSFHKFEPDRDIQIGRSADEPQPGRTRNGAYEY